MRAPGQAAVLLLCLGIAACSSGGRAAAPTAAASSSPSSVAEVPRLAVTADGPVQAAPGRQNEPAVAVRPGRPQELLVAATDWASQNYLVATSSDGGRTWRSERLPDAAGFTGMVNPAVGIAPDGRQYVSVITYERTTGRSFLLVATRATASDPWVVGPQPVAAPLGSATRDWRPDLVVDAGTASPHAGRVYVAWSRTLRAQPLEQLLLVSHSDDQGRTWTVPSLVDRGPLQDAPRMAVTDDGRVLVVWQTTLGFLSVSRSDDGVAFTGPKVLTPTAVPPGRGGCFGWLLPAVPSCGVRPGPRIAVAAGRVHVAYSEREDGRQRVLLRSLPLDLSGAPEQQDLTALLSPDGSDDLLPGLAGDEDSLVACWYTTGSRPARQEVDFVCSHGNGSGQWSAPVQVTGEPSDESGSQDDQLPPEGREYGDSVGVAVQGDSAFTVWTDSRRSSTTAADVRAAVLQLR